MSSVPPPLAYLVSVLDAMDDSCWCALVGAVVSGGDTSVAVEQCSRCGIEGAKAIQQCTFLVQKASKGVDKHNLTGRLLPLGFTAAQVGVLHDMMQNPNIAQLNATAAITEPASRAEPEPELTAVQIARRELGMDSDDGSDDGSSDEMVSEDEMDPVETVRSQMAGITIKNLKVILRYVAQHIVGQNITAKALNRVESALTASGIEASLIPSLLRLYQRGIQARAAQQPVIDDLMICPLGSGHLELLEAAANWCDKNRPEVTEDLSVEDILGKHVSGWLDVVDKPPSSKLLKQSQGAGMTWVPRWFRLRQHAVEVFASPSDADQNVRGSEYSLIPASTLVVPKKGLEGSMPTGTKAERAFSFSIELSNNQKVLGAPLPKTLMLDARDEQQFELWSAALKVAVDAQETDDDRRAREQARQTRAQAQQARQRADADQARREELAEQKLSKLAAVNEKDPSPDELRGTILASSASQVPGGSLLAALEAQAGKGSAVSADADGGIESWDEVGFDDDTAVVPPQRCNVTVVGTQLDLRGQYVAYRFGVENDETSEWNEFQVRYSVAEQKHTELFDDGTFKATFAPNDQPKIPPKHTLKDMVSNADNVELRAEELRQYFSHIFSNWAIRDSPAWKWVFHPEIEEEGIPPTEETEAVEEERGCMDGCLFVEQESGDWLPRWFILMRGELTIQEDESSTEFICKLPVAACDVSLLPVKDSKKAPFCFRIDMSEEAEAARVKGIPLTTTVVDPRSEENKKRWLTAFVDAMLVDNENEGRLRLECGAQKAKLRVFESRFFRLSNAMTLQMFDDTDADGDVEEPLSDPLLTLDLANCAIREVKTARGGLEHTFRLDIAGTVILKGQDIHKLIIDAGDSESKADWKSKLERACAAAQLEVYLRSVRYLFLSNDLLIDRLVEHEPTLKSKQAVLVEAISEDPDNKLLQQRLQMVSKDLGRRRLGDSVVMEFDDEEVERCILCPGGCHIHCKFGEGSLGIVFEGEDGKDVHISTIAQESQASLMENLTQGLQLVQVQEHVTKQITDIDVIMGLIVNSSRPLHLRFWRAAKVTSTFYDMEATGLLFSGLNGAGSSEFGPLRLRQVQKDSEAWDTVQLRPGLVVKEVETYDGEEFGCRSTPAQELLALIDTPRRPLKLTFVDPEFDDEDVARRAEADAARAREAAARVQLSEGEVLASLESFKGSHLLEPAVGTGGGAISNPMNDCRVVTLRVARSGLAVVERQRNGDSAVVGFYPPSCILAVRAGADSTAVVATSVQVKERHLAGDDSKTTWLKFIIDENAAAFVTALEKLRSQGGSSQRCFDPEVIRYWNENPTSRVAPYKEGCVETEVLSKVERLKNGGSRWSRRLLCLNEATLTCYRLQTTVEPGSGASSRGAAGADPELAQGEMVGEVELSFPVSSIRRVRLAEASGKVHGAGFRVATLQGGYAKAHLFSCANAAEWVSAIRLCGKLKT